MPDIPAPNGQGASNIAIKYHNLNPTWKAQAITTLRLKALHCRERQGLPKTGTGAEQHNPCQIREYVGRNAYAEEQHQALAPQHGFIPET